MEIKEFNEIGFTGGTEVEFLNNFFEVLSMDYQENTITIIISDISVVIPIELCERDMRCKNGTT